VLALAKGYTSGPALTLKATLKLKFNDVSVLRRANNQIDHPPLNLRDGSVIIVRGIADYEKIREAMRVKKEAEGPRPITAGTGAAAAKAKRPQSRGRYPSALPKEKGLKISSSVEGGLQIENPPPPVTGGGCDVMPSAP
jgi:hypothetical protein